ncbi:MAG TPA: porin [Methylophilaceae bacterium]|nr:porin [Methylophilaceae bacterium]
MKKIHSAVAAFCGTLMMAGSMHAMADSTDDIVHALISKGVLTEEEGALLLKGRAGEKEAQEKAKKDNASVKVGKKGLEIASPDGNFTMNIGGRLHTDWTYHDGDNNLLVGGDPTEPIEATDGTDIRRARIAIRGTVLKDFNYILETDFAGDEVRMKDVFLAYTGLEPMEFTFGHQKQAMSMELEESSNDIMFTERSLITAMTSPYFDRAIGFTAKGFGESWNVQAGVYGDAMGRNTSEGREGSGWAVRGTVAPINTENRLLHLGANFGQREANFEGEPNSGTARLRNETTNMSDLYLTNTGTIDGFNKMSLGILEAAAMWGPWSIQSEFAKAKIDRDAGRSLDFDGLYVQMGWTITGESRTYKGSDGEFKRLKPRNDFDLRKGKWGAWEVAARYDQIDLEDQDIEGGEQKRATLGLNWYLNENVRLMADYSRSFDLENSPITTDSGDEPDSIDVFNLRAQWAF